MKFKLKRLKNPWIGFHVLLFIPCVIGLLMERNMSQTMHFYTGFVVLWGIGFALYYITGKFGIYMLMAFFGLSMVAVFVVPYVWLGTFDWEQSIMWAVGFFLMVGELTGALDWEKKNVAAPPPQEV